MPMTIDPELEEMEAADTKTLARDGGVVGSWGIKVGRSHPSPAATSLPHIQSTRMHNKEDPYTTNITNGGLMI
jgi:hypothetical protein